MLFFLPPKLSELSIYQRKEYAKIWFDLSKLSIASLVLKAIEPTSMIADGGTVVTIIAGLLAFCICVRIGMIMSIGVKS